VLFRSVLCRRWRSGLVKHKRGSLDPRAGLLPGRVQGPICPFTASEQYECFGALGIQSLGRYVDALVDTLRHFGHGLGLRCLVWRGGRRARGGQAAGQGMPAVLAELAPCRADQIRRVGVFIPVGNQQYAAARLRLSGRQKKTQKSVVADLQLAQLSGGELSA